MAGAWEAALPPGLRWSSAQTLSRGLRQPGAVAPATALRRGPPELSDPAGARAERPLAVSTLGACAPGLAQVRGVCPSPRGARGPGVRTGEALGAGCCGRGGERHGDAPGAAQPRRPPGHRVPRAPQPPARVGGGGWGFPKAGCQPRARGGRRVTYWPSGLETLLGDARHQVWAQPARAAPGWRATWSSLRGNPGLRSPARTCEARAQGRGSPVPTARPH